MSAISRRAFAAQTIGSLLTMSLLETLFSRDLFAAEAKTLAAKWLADLNAMSRELKGEKLKQVEWQAKVEELFAKVDLADTLRLIDFDKLTKGIEFNERGERALHPAFPKVEGLPRELVFGHQVFALNKGRSVVPHGHDNMATAFLILKGKFHGRHFDRLEDDKTHMIIKPTIDRAFTVAEYSTISDDKDNVHWFQATEDASFIFNIHVDNINPKSKKAARRVYCDPAGEKLSGGRIRARKIGGGEAIKLYG